MWELLKLLLLSETIALTAAPIGIEQGCSVSFRQEVSAINSKAYVYVDVTSEFTAQDFDGPIDKLEALKDRFPSGMISVELSNSASGKSIIIPAHSFAVSKDQLMLDFSAPAELHAHSEFDVIRITTTTKIQDVLVYWKNGSA